jgi:hypothetical protein
MENIAGPGGIHSVYTIRAGMMKAVAVPGEYASGSEGCSGDTAPELLLQERKRLL